MLLPDDANARARAIAWLFAALNTVEPPIVEFGMSLLLERDKPWFAERQPTLEARVRARLDELSAALGERDWLDGEFSVADLMMVTVLRRAGRSGIFGDYPALAAYIESGVANRARTSGSKCSSGSVSYAGSNAI